MSDVSERLIARMEQFTERLEGGLLPCPDCHGDGKAVASFVDYADGSAGYGVPFHCGRCEGTGEVSVAMIDWIRAGDRMRAWRREQRRTLGAEAKRRGLSASELSLMERGCVEPVLPPETQGR